MPIKNPNTPYERAYNAWSYGGGQQRGEPMPRARDFASEYEDEDRRRMDEPAPYSGSGRDEEQRRLAESTYQRAPPMGGGTYDPRGTGVVASPPPYGGMPGAGGIWNPNAPKLNTEGTGYTDGTLFPDEEQRRLAESPAVVQRAREFERRRRRPQGGRGAGASLGSLNRR